MRLGSRSLWLLLALLLAAPGHVRSDDPPSDGPDGLKSLTQYWKGRPAGAESRRPVVQGNTIRVKPGQLIKLTPEPDWPAEVEWDWPETLVAREDTDQYHIDNAARTLILPSDRPGEYRVTAWGCVKPADGLLPVGPPMSPEPLGKPDEKPGDPDKPEMKPGKPAPAAPVGKPRRLKVWTVIVEGAKAQTDGPPLKDDTVPVPDSKDIASAVKADLKDPSNKEPLAKLQAEFARLADEAETGTKWKKSGDANKEINKAIADVPQGKLPQTVKAVSKRLKDDPDITFLGAPATSWTAVPRARTAYAKALREIANALK
jgi:hypothetical protein